MGFAQKQRNMWRSYDRPRVGTIFRLPDDLQLQRGITYTILPDGRSIRVPSMNRQLVRAQSDKHSENEGHDIMQALQDILQGSKPVPGRARHDRRGRVQGGRVPVDVRPHGGMLAHVQHGQGGPIVPGGGLQAAGAPHPAPAAS